MPRGGQRKFSLEIEDEICRKYQEGIHHSTVSLAKEYGFTARGIGLLLKRHGVERRDRGIYTFDHVGTGKTSGEKQYRRRGNKAFKDECAICSKTKSLLIHHINGNHYDNDLSNLLKICGRCHVAIHSYKPTDLQRLRELKSRGYSNRAIARELGVSDLKIGRELALLGLSNNQGGYRYPESLEKIRYYARKLHQTKEAN